MIDILSSHNFSPRSLLVKNCQPSLVISAKFLSQAFLIPKPPLGLAHRQALPFNQVSLPLVLSTSPEEIPINFLKPIRDRGRKFTHLHKMARDCRGERINKALPTSNRQPFSFRAR